MNSFQDVKDQLSSSGCGFRNPGATFTVEWASARSRQWPFRPLSLSTKLDNIEAMMATLVSCESS